MFESQELLDGMKLKYPTQWFHFHNNNWTHESFVDFLDAVCVEFVYPDYETAEKESSKHCIFCFDETKPVVQIIDDNLETPIMVCEDCK